MLGLPEGSQIECDNFSDPSAGSWRRAYYTASTSVIFKTFKIKTVKTFFSFPKN